jgi:hypothetical protein
MDILFPVEKSFYRALVPARRGLKFTKQGNIKRHYSLDNRARSIQVCTRYRITCLLGIMYNINHISTMSDLQPSRQRTTFSEQLMLQFPHPSYPFPYSHP